MHVPGCTLSPPPWMSNPLTAGHLCVTLSRQGIMPSPCYLDEDSRPRCFALTKSICNCSTQSGHTARLDIVRQGTDACNPKLRKAGSEATATQQEAAEQLLLSSPVLFGLRMHGCTHWTGLHDWASQML